MLKINTNTLPEISWSSPKGKFVGAGKEVSEALGRDPYSTDLNLRHPFDVEICRISPSKTPYPYGSHSAQWEFYHVISGTGKVRHQDGMTDIESAMLSFSNQENRISLSMTVPRTSSSMW